MADTDTARALDVARDLVRAGVPVFVAAPCRPDCDSKKHKPGEGTGRSGFHLPLRWETTTTAGNQVDRWRPGWALCAVMGHVVDLADVDPRSGGDATKAGLQRAGAWPRSYGQAATPSGGTHDFIAPLRVHSLDGVAAGLDVKSGAPDGEGRGFAYIAPTVKRSKATGELATYRWLVEPDLSTLDPDDDSGATLAGMVAAKRNGKKHASDDEFDWSDFGGPWDDLKATLADNTRRAAVFKLAAALRGRGGWRMGDALEYMKVRVWPLIDQEKGGHEFPIEEFDDNIRSAFVTYPDGPDGGDTPEPSAFARTIYRRSELTKLPRVDPLIEGILSLRAAVVLFGPTNAGKTLVGLSWACCVAMGVPWLGHPVHRAKVLYVLGEGAYGYDDRVTAWETAWHTKVDDEWLIFAVKPESLSSRVTWAQIHDEAKALGVRLIMLDTFSSLAYDADETKDAPVFTRRMSDLAGAIDGTVVVVHHPGWGDPDRVRGGSQLEANVDEVVKLTGSAVEPEIELTRKKVKDGEAGARLRLRRVQVPIGVDDGGIELMSVTVEAHTGRRRDAAPPRWLMAWWESYRDEWVSASALEKGGIRSSSAFHRDKWELIGSGLVAHDKIHGHIKYRLTREPV